MTKQEEIQIEKVCNEIKKTGCFEDKEKHLLRNIFGKRFENALKALTDSTIKKYVFTPSQKTVWIVVGKEMDYQIIPEVNFCSCDDFYFRVLNKESTYCYHLIAQKLADSLNKYRIINESDELFEALMKDWRCIKNF